MTTQHRGHFESTALDRSYELMENDINREVIQHFLGKHDPVANRDEIVQTIMGTRPQKDHSEVATILHHHNLPQLAEAEVVAYEQQSGKVTFLGDEVIEAILETPVDSTSPEGWARTQCNAKARGGPTRGY